MKIVALTDEIGVSEQITAEDIPAIAAAGYAVLINNRPDGEVDGQPGSAEVAVAAADAGLEYHYLPVTAQNFPGPDVEQMAKLLDDPNRRVMAFCRTGTRCANLWVATRSQEAREEARAHAHALGYDLAMSDAL
ncbi:MAG: TIGR01244 family sulfur transferase [Pseudomonadota bacterium]